MKKSEIYDYAVMAVIENNCLTTAQKATIIHELSAEHRFAKSCEERGEELGAQEVYA